MDSKEILDENNNAQADPDSDQGVTQTTSDVKGKFVMLFIVFRDLRVQNIFILLFVFLNAVIKTMRLLHWHISSVESLLSCLAKSKTSRVHSEDTNVIAVVVFRRDLSLFRSVFQNNRSESCIRYFISRKITTFVGQISFDLSDHCALQPVYLPRQVAQFFCS